MRKSRQMFFCFVDEKVHILSLKSTSKPFDAIEESGGREYLISWGWGESAGFTKSDKGLGCCGLPPNKGYGEAVPSFWGQHFQIDAYSTGKLHLIFKF